MQHTVAPGEKEMTSREHPCRAQIAGKVAAHLSMLPHELRGLQEPQGLIHVPAEKGRVHCRTTGLMFKVQLAEMHRWQAKRNAAHASC